MFIDSHCHLDDEEFQEDLSSIIQRAKDMQVARLLTISTTLSALSSVAKISASSPWIYHSVGVHPNEVTKDGIPTVEKLITHCQNPKAVGLGETGLDYYYENSDRNQQQESFRNHIRASLTTGLPLIIHSRDAEADILSILQEFSLRENPGVIHCFTGTKSFATSALKIGFYISVSGIITFKNAENLRDIIKEVPLDRLLIETDAPYLAPVPYRGKRNEPSFVVHTAEAIAHLKGIPTQQLGNITTQNFFKLFTRAQ